MNDEGEIHFHIVQVTSIDNYISTKGKEMAELMKSSKVYKPTIDTLSLSIVLSMQIIDTFSLHID